MPALRGRSVRASPAYQAQVWSPRERKTIRKTFPTLAEARAWRQETPGRSPQRDAALALARSRSSEAAAEWLAAADAGLVRTRSGDAIQALRAPRLPAGTQPPRPAHASAHKRLTAVSHNMLQDFADQLSRPGTLTKHVRNTILPLRAIYRRAHRRGEVAINPTLNLALPAVRSQRDRVAAPTKSAALLDALPASERAICATALYAGLRLGELQALALGQTSTSTHNLIHVRQKLGPPSRIHRTQKPRRQPPRPDHPHPPPRTSSTTASSKATGGQGFVFPNKPRQQALQPRHPQTPHHKRLDAARTHTDRPPRMPPQLRRLHDRRRHQHQSPQHLHGPLHHHHHPRPLRPPPPRQRNTKPPHLLDTWLTKAVS